jgi:hypothetical protein
MAIIVYRDFPYVHGGFPYMSTYFSAMFTSSIQKPPSLPNPLWARIAILTSSFPLLWYAVILPSTMEAIAATKSIVRLNTGESYQQMHLRMAKYSGIVSPTSDDLREKSFPTKIGNSRPKITKIKDGRTHLLTSPSKAVGLDSGAIVVVDIL